MNPTYVYRARLDRVVDGDTFIAIVDLGFRVSLTINVRLHGVNAPEHNRPGGQASKQFLIDLLGDRDLVLRSYKDTMSFTRWVCDVWLPMDDTSVTDHIIKAGFGAPFDPKVDHWTR